MMEYYTQRHGMRHPIDKTSDISVEKYALLFRCCQKYYDNIAWKYPEQCPDGAGCCGINYEALTLDLKYEIPTLFRNSYGSIDIPCEHRNIFDSEPTYDSYDQFALLDYIEFIGENLRDISRKVWHDYFRHHDLTFSANKAVFSRFRADINDIFCKTGLLYELNPDGWIERVEENGVLTSEIEMSVAAVAEDGLRDLLQKAIVLHKSPRPTDHQDAVEKMWDALERLKTYYTDLDKKASVKKIVNDISGGQSDFMQQFDDEFVALTKIGNNYRIRHHETNKIDITDTRHFDYFFNRCLSLISLALQYL